MATATAIQWTDATWNPWHGCHKVSQGCKNCYMFRGKARYGQDPNVVQRSKTLFRAPLKWAKEPAMCFTCSWSDWFIEEADPWRNEAYDIIIATPHITYQILTKRIERAAVWFPNPYPPNIWLGVSVENRETKHRIDTLRSTPAALRFLSLEPLLEDLGQINLTGIDWVIVGGESQSGARPLDIAWVRSIIRQCREARVACFVKQLGARPVMQTQDWLDNGSNGAYYDPKIGDAYRVLAFRDRKGGDISEWPEDLQVREFPQKEAETNG